MINNPKVTIITICFNSNERIEKTIQSVIGQTYKNIEYIIIDGNSTDGTQKVVEQYRKHIAFFLSEPDKGISDAFNKGINKASGDLVALLNSDDYFNSDAIEIMVKKYVEIGSPHNTVLHGQLKVIGSDGRIKIQLPRSFSRFIFELPIWHPTTFFTKDIYGQYQYNTEYKIAMDYELLSKVYASEGNFVYVPHIINNMSEEGISNTAAIKGFKEVKKASIKNLKVNPWLAEILCFYRITLYSLMMLKRKIVN